MKQKIYHASAWTPGLVVIAHEVISKINEACPGLEVLFMGAGALGLPGKNDIDLDILCESEKLAIYTQKISSALGAEAIVKDGKASLEYTYKGFEVDIFISDPMAPNSHIQRQKRNFEILKSSPDLREHYMKLKLECDGKPYHEYEAKKAEFLDQLEDL